MPVGKVKTIEPDKQTGRSDVVIQLDSRYAPLPSDARAILRQKTLLGETYVELTPGTETAPTLPEGGAAARRRRCRRPSSSTRSTARSTRARARRSRSGCRRRRRRSSGHGQDINDALGNLGPVRRGRERGGRHPEPPGAARCGGWSRNTGVVFGALTERGGQLRGADRELQPRVRDHRLARPAAAGGVRRAADVLPRVARDARPARRVRARHQPARHPAAPGGARAEPDADATWRRSRPTSRRCSATSTS